MKKKTILIIGLLLTLFLTFFVSLYYQLENKNLSYKNSVKKQQEKMNYEKTLKEDLVNPILILTKDKITVYKGDDINYMSFVKTATDNLEGDLKSKVKYNKINTQKIGEYNIEYEVKDKASNLTKAKLKVIVKEKPNFKY